jgi:hypothetical protein
MLRASARVAPNIRRSNMNYPKSTEPTRYEVALKHSDGRAWRICYTAGSPSRRQLRQIVSENSNLIRECLGAEGQRQTGDWKTKPRPCWQGGEWWLGYTGRTQREAIGEKTELDWIGSIHA